MRYLKRIVVYLWRSFVYMLAYISNRLGFSEQKIKKNVGSVMRVKGLTLYKMSTTTGVITEVEISTDIVGLNDKGNTKSQVNYEKGYIYIQALNAKNAKRKFEKIVRQVSK